MKPTTLSAIVVLFAVGSFAACTVDSPDQTDDTEAEQEEVGQAQEAIGSCAHPRCATGTPLNPTCDGCVGQICAADPYCCTTAWDQLCINAVESCENEYDDPNVITCGCSHSAYDDGAALGDNCTPCVREICNFDAYCCNVVWDDWCEAHADTGVYGDTEFRACWPE